MERLIDIWIKRRVRLSILVGKLQSEEVLEVLRRVVMECENSSHLAPVLIGEIHGMVERKEA
jgi:hypothetical protein